MDAYDLNDRNTRLTLSDAADLAQVSIKTLSRDRDAGRLTMFNDHGKWFVTVRALIDAGRYVPDPHETVGERLSRGRAEARIRELEAELAMCRHEQRHLSDLLEQANEWADFLKGLLSTREVA
jgi:hypothetical protein